MFVRCIGSGSSGNSYALYDNSENILLLDLGLPRKEILKAIDFRVSDVVGAVVTHEHKDHSRAVKDFEDMGIPVFKPYESEMPRQVRTYGSFAIKSFDLPHNGTENRGFLIDVAGQRILYMTDFEYCKYNFQSLKINHILIEANYQKELVEIDLPNYEHKIKGHCSLKTCCDFIKSNKTNALRTVILCHLGAETTIAEECIGEVQKVADCPAYVAEKGLEVDLRKYPF